MEFQLWWNLFQFQFYSIFRTFLLSNCNWIGDTHCHGTRTKVQQCSFLAANKFSWSISFRKYRGSSAVLGFRSSCLRKYRNSLPRSSASSLSWQIHCRCCPCENLRSCWKIAARLICKVERLLYFFISVLQLNAFLQHPMKPTALRYRKRQNAGIEKRNCARISCQMLLHRWLKISALLFERVETNNNWRFARHFVRDF